MFCSFKRIIILCNFCKDKKEQKDEAKKEKKINGAISGDYAFNSGDPKLQTDVKGFPKTYLTYQNLHDFKFFLCICNIPKQTLKISLFTNIFFLFY